DRRLRQGVEVVGSARGHRHHTPGRRPVRDGSGLTRRLLEVPERDVVGVRVARPGAGLGPDTRPLADVPRGFFDNTFLDYELFIDAVLEVDVGVLDAPAQRGAEEAIDETGGDVEA